MKRENILAHRGVWYSKAEKNTPAALEKAFQMGFGIETDFRDLGGDLVVSHDPPTNGFDYNAQQLFAAYSNIGTPGRLALNIKADGLQGMLLEALAAAKVDPSRYFAFDMAVPDALGYLGREFPAYTRISEYEQTPSFLSQATGVWVDNFTGNFPQVESARALLADGHRVAIVSPELHGRDHTEIWDQILAAGLHTNPKFELCTDLPEAAIAKFGEDE